MVRIRGIIIFHPSKLWKATFSTLWGVANGKTETHRHAETLVWKSGPETQAISEPNKKKTSLRDSVETLPRFRDRAKIFQDPRFLGTIRNPYCVKWYFWWGCRGNLTLYRQQITIHSNSKKHQGSTVRRFGIQHHLVLVAVLTNRNTSCPPPPQTIASLPVFCLLSPQLEMSVPQGPTLSWMTQLDRSTILTKQPIHLQNAMTS